MEKDVAKDCTEGSHQVDTRSPGAVPPGPAPGSRVGPTCPPSRRLFAFLKPLDLKPSRTEKFSTKQNHSRRHLETLFGGSAALFWHPAGGGNHHRRPLRHHDCIQNDA